MSDNNFPATITLALCQHHNDSLKCIKCFDDKLSIKQKEQQYGYVGGNVVVDKHPGI